MEFLQRVIDQRKDESYEEAVESMNSDDRVSSDVPMK